jgi:hypothetical protein
MTNNNHHNGTPTTLPTHNGVLAKSGPAREPGGTLYINFNTGERFSIFQAVVSTTGHRGFCFATVLNNAALPRVMVPESCFAVSHTPTNGEILLIGDLVFGGPSPKAQIAWPGSNGHSPKQAFPKPAPPLVNGSLPRKQPSFRTGSVVRVEKTFAIIQEDNAERTLLAPGAQFADNRDMRLGCRVTFGVASSDGRALAINVRSAR